MSRGCMVFIDSVEVRTGVLESTENCQHGPVEAAAVWAAAQEAAKIVVRNRFARPSIDYVNIAYQQIRIHLSGQSHLYRITVGSEPVYSIMPPALGRLTNGNGITYNVYQAQDPVGRSYRS